MFVCIYMFLGLPSLLEKPAHHSLCFSMFLCAWWTYRFNFHFESDSVTTWLSLPEFHSFCFSCCPAQGLCVACFSNMDLVIQFNVFSVLSKYFIHTWLSLPEFHSFCFSCCPAQGLCVACFSNMDLVIQFNVFCFIYNVYSVLFICMY